jgi:hypothetical protein
VAGTVRLTSAEILANLAQKAPRGFATARCQMTGCDGCKRTRFCLLLDSAAGGCCEMSLCQDCISTLFHKATIIPWSEKR